MIKQHLSKTLIFFIVLISSFKTEIAIASLNVNFGVGNRSYKEINQQDATKNITFTQTTPFVQLGFDFFLIDDFLSFGADSSYFTMASKQLLKSATFLDNRVFSKISLKARPFDIHLIGEYFSNLFIPNTGSFGYGKLNYYSVSLFLQFITEKKGVELDLTYALLSDISLYNNYSAIVKFLVENSKNNYLTLDFSYKKNIFSKNSNTLIEYDQSIILSTLNYHY